VLCVLPPPLASRYRAELDRLVAAGAQVVVEPSPAIAVTAAGVRRPGVIIMGLSMPEMEGLELCALLQQQHPDLPAPMVVLPDPGDPLDPLVCVRDGATGGYGIEHYAREDIWDHIAQLCGLTATGPAAIPVQDVVEPTERVAAGPPPAPPPGPPADAPGAAWPELVALESGPVEPAPAAAGAAPPAPVPLAAVAPLAPAPVAAIAPPAPVAAPPRPSRGRAGTVAGGALVALAAAAAGVWLALRPAALPLRPHTRAPERVPAGAALALAPRPSAPPLPAARATAGTPASPRDWLAPGVHLLPLTFARGAEAPRPTDEPALAGLIAVLARPTRCRLTLIGHTSAEGDARLNDYLGHERARAARALLLARGARPGVLATASAGAKQPLVPGADDEAQARNRRVELEVRCP
jgi:outer membrane protein OmpA-like peptidoglycan-associated protein